MTGTARSPEIGERSTSRTVSSATTCRDCISRPLAAHLVGSQGTLRIVSLNARAAPGELSVSGTIGVLQPKLPIELELTAKNAQPITSDILTANLDAELKVRGDAARAAGRVRHDQPASHGDRHSERHAAGRRGARRAAARPGAAPAAGAQARDRPRSELHAPRQILLQGRGLDAELGGDMHIGGTTASPLVSGGFEMIRGTFALASTQLTFTKGEVSFNGAGLKRKIDPTLDFTAQANDGTSTLHITGLADSPQFELSSTPSLPQDEILARLLFGESASQLTALQVAQIGAALASLSGVGGSGPNPLARVQKALGLDRLSVGGGTNR